MEECNKYINKGTPLSNEVQKIHDDFREKIISVVNTGTFQSFAWLIQTIYGKEVADEYRKIIIKEGKWVMMDGTLYNGTEQNFIR